ncbi:MAG: MFS transporter [Deltaproteobacteria bacterium]
MLLNDKKVINGWAFYDWANSAYFLVISTAIFPAYFIARTNEVIDLFGYNIKNSTIYSYAVSLSYLFIVVVSPILSGIADYGGKRMFFLKFFTYLGSISCIALFFFTGDINIWIGVGAFILATIGAAGGLVFYDAYLPEIATEDQFDKVSAKGFSYGYLGSVLLLILILFISLNPGIFGIPTNSTLPYRLGFAFVGIWWMGFAQISFKRLPRGKNEPMDLKLIGKGITKINSVLVKVLKNKNLSLYLASVFFFSAGVQTVIYLASVFAKEELKFQTDELIIIILIIQLIGILGAYIFAVLSKKTGNKTGLAIMIIIWTAITFAAYFVQSKTQFYLLAGLVGLVMGGIQSQARASYSKLVENDKKELTSFFSFFEIMIKLSIVIGTFAFGLVNQITGDLRKSVLSLAFFFVAGVIFLLVSNFEKAKKKVTESAE